MQSEPRIPAEIRAPAGTLAGVSGFQVHFSSHDIHTPGDHLNALVAMNPAALKTNLKDLEYICELASLVDQEGQGWPERIAEYREKLHRLAGEIPG